MKTNQRIIIILMFMMMAGLSDIYAQNKREIKEQREQAIKEQIIAEKYKISVNTAYPRRGRTVHLSSPYSVEITPLFPIYLFTDELIQFLMVEERD